MIGEDQIEALAKTGRCDLDGQVVEIMPMTYGKGRLVIGTGTFVERAWCYDTPTAAILAFAVWDGEGDPDGWFKNPITGVYRPENTRQDIDPAHVRLDPGSVHYKAPTP